MKRQANILYVDDEILFVRTVKRILRYSDLCEKVKITAAYHALDAISQVKENGQDFFDAILVDYRLEPDKSPKDDYNGEKLVKKLKDEILESQNCLFYLLSATDKEDDAKVFNRTLDKSSDTLDQDLYAMFKEVHEKIKYPYEINSYTDEECKFKGNDRDRKLLRYQIDKHLQNKDLLLLYGNRLNITNLICDIQNKRHISCCVQDCCRIDLTERDLSGNRIDFSHTIENLEQKIIDNCYYVICFEKFNKLEVNEQEELIELVRDRNIRVIFACDSIPNCLNITSKDLICGEENSCIPKLYKITI